MLITFIIKRPTSPETQKKNQCHETRELPSTPHYLINQMQQWWRSATTLYNTLYKIARFFSFLYKNSPPPIWSQTQPITNYNSFHTQANPSNVILNVFKYNTLTTQQLYYKQKKF